MGSVNHKRKRYIKQSLKNNTIAQLSDEDLIEFTREELIHKLRNMKATYNRLRDDYIELMSKESYAQRKIKMLEEENQKIKDKVKSEEKKTKKWYHEYRKWKGE